MGEILLIAKARTIDLRLFVSRKDLNKTLEHKINYIALGETSESILGIYAIER